MITLLEMTDEGMKGLEERMEFRQELLAFFGEVHVALCRMETMGALQSQGLPVKGQP